jgi:DNA polymerase-4
VQPDRVRKSVGAETTFRQDLTSEEDMLGALRTLTDQVCERLRLLKTAAMTVTVKMKYDDFVQVTRSKTFSEPQQEAHEVFPAVAYLLHHPIPPARPVRLLGISLSNLTPEAGNLPRQLTLPW